MGRRGPKQEPLDYRQKWAAFLLAFRQGRTKEDIAEECEVSRMTLLWKREQRADFQELGDKEYRKMVNVYLRQRKYS